MARPEVVEFDRSAVIGRSAHCGLFPPALRSAQVTVELELLHTPERSDFRRRDKQVGDVQYIYALATQHARVGIEGEPCGAHHARGTALRAGRDIYNRNSIPLRRRIAGGGGAKYSDRYRHHLGSSDKDTAQLHRQPHRQSASPKNCYWSGLFLDTPRRIVELSLQSRKAREAQFLPRPQVNQDTWGLLSFQTLSRIGGFFARPADSSVKDTGFTFPPGEPQIKAARRTVRRSELLAHCLYIYQNGGTRLLEVLPLDLNFNVQIGATFSKITGDYNLELAKSQSVSGSLNTGSFWLLRGPCHTAPQLSKFEFNVVS
ncbi:hypothetical protein Q8A73_010558 [Channa argus]|nr:hypothetical protein Q8A73_010558 [Channa argus]